MFYLSPKWYIIYIKASHGRTTIYNISKDIILNKCYRHFFDFKQAEQSF